jgi:hypothetical protein
LVAQLYDLYLGSASSIPEEVRSPANKALKAKILKFLLKSVLAANQTEKAAKMIFDCLYGKHGGMCHCLAADTTVK